MIPRAAYYNYMTTQSCSPKEGGEEERERGTRQGTEGCGGGGGGGGRSDLVAASSEIESNWWEQQIFTWGAINRIKGEQQRRWEGAGLGFSLFLSGCRCRLKFVLNVVKSC